MNYVQNAHIAAQRADNAWTRQLFLAGFKSRWAPGSHGDAGTDLRAAYDAKVAADRVCHAAFEQERSEAKLARKAGTK